MKATADERDNIEAIVDTYYESAYRFAYILSNHEPDVFAVVIHAFRQSRVRLRRQQLLRKAERLIFSCLYLECRREFGDSPQGFESIHDPSSTCYQSILDSIRSLRWELRAALAFFYITKLSLKETAEIIGVSVTVLVARIGEAKRLLCKHRAQDGIFNPSTHFIS